MAQFYGVVQGDRGEVSRRGSKNSGMQAHIRGWDIGVRVECSFESGHDVIRIYGTGGSRDPNKRKAIARIHHDGTIEMYV